MRAILTLTLMVCIWMAAWIAGGQFGGVMQPLFSLASIPASGGYSITNLNGMQHYWNYRDTADGHVGGLTDRVQQLVWMPIHATWPIKDTNGIHFTNNVYNYLTNPIYATVATNRNNMAIGLIMKSDQNAASYQIFLTATNDVNSHLLLQAPSGPNAQVWEGAGLRQLSGTFNVTNCTDILFWICQINGGVSLWTNGVLSRTNQTGQGTSRDWCITALGGRGGSTADYQYKGAILELFIRTNVTDPVSVAADWHNYRTNVYPWIP